MHKVLDSQYCWQTVADSTLPIAWRPFPPPKSAVKICFQYFIILGDDVLHSNYDWERFCFVKLKEDYFSKWQNP